jgi:hypothetical protein
MVKQQWYIVLTGEFSADECKSSPGRSINLNGGAAQECNNKLSHSVQLNP